MKSRFQYLFATVLALAACTTTETVTNLGWQARHAAGEALREAVRFAETPLPDAWTEVAVSTTPVAINDPALEEGAGALIYRGGVVITSGFDRLHGLSDLAFTNSEQFHAISDEGLLVRGRVQLDVEGRLVGVTGVAARALLDPDGQALVAKFVADAEGLARSGDELLVSFERDHRVWRYDPATARYLGDRAMPDYAFTENEGPEAIAAGPGDAFWLAGEDGGLWSCRQICEVVQAPPLSRPSEDDLRVTAMDADPTSSALFVLQRAWHADRNTNTIRISRWRDPSGQGPDTLAEFTAPATVDNFEGIAAVRRPDGGVRLYILSDDNFNETQRTLLLAFDVR